MSVPAPESPSFEHVDFEALDSFRFPDGGGYPQSYREFVRSCGWARTLGLWLIYPPVQPGFADGRARAANLTEHFHTVFRDGEEEEFDWMIEPDGSWDLAERLEVFGWSENGDLLLWDVASRNADEEFPVWESRGMNTLHLLGSSLDEALLKLRERSEAQVIEPLRPARL
ncbi:hypothetical protein BTZ20_0749 [Rhodococcus sp. MTM3W5.2]|uniref:hypothetical protein n=1 Tax=Rhodococcus sp. MTM3W5.2 TaxID=1805827 RepID=UPI00097957B7|nr:hypothetical protein [Rhodococcus sp. MTM3W5.2]AQA25549.1 hypothetical protein BTZ20_0749 [Rhodococcus sp. MTM3W5.2]